MTQHMGKEIRHCLGLLIPIAGQWMRSSAGLRFCRRYRVAIRKLPDCGPNISSRSREIPDTRILVLLRAVKLSPCIR